MAGWGTLTGEANHTLSCLFHTNDPKTKLGAFNVRACSNPVMDKVIEESNRLVAVDRPSLPIAAVAPPGPSRRTR
ncbi:hypothetical protein QNA08_07365 [Chelatococcus sp. SYSU_G07232]|uniref:Uncharacterized protein n=1 Tax=Chelatococcus albus TaxID=3047466 RepID=A0ABT7AHD5_9HYPH|nr:hypothetical protein [Chelatococcus sp. SYSU_G07232]MDJ1158051.1 hypothetical protein [Chelatococcus sp. SYSU_G07232]